MTKQEFSRYGIDFTAYINEEKRTVVVTTSYSTVNFMDYKYTIDVEGVQGKAKCHPEDDFNAQEGIRVATTKLLNSILKLWNNKLLKEVSAKEAFADFVYKRKKV